MFRFICEWCSFYIATHPEVEAKIVEELTAGGLLATPQQLRPRPLAYDDLAGLTYLGVAHQGVRTSPTPNVRLRILLRLACSLDGTSSIVALLACTYQLLMDVCPAHVHLPP